MEYAVKCAEDNGTDCALRLADSFDKVVDSLQELPERGVKKLRYIPSRYHIIKNCTGGKNKIHLHV